MGFVVSIFAVRKTLAKYFAQENIHSIMKRSLRILSGLALLALMFLVPVSAVKGSTVGSASCSWDAVADPSVSGYKVYWGIQSGVYDHSLDAGNVTQVIIPGFSPGVQYFSAVTAYSNTGGESDYSTEVSFSVSTAVVPATPVITTPPSAAAIVYGQTLASSTLSGGVASVPGSFTFTAPATAPAAGTTSQSVTFTPTDIANYQTVTTVVSVTATVSKTTPSITTLPTATAISYGQTLASSTLSGGAASVPGSFAFTTPAKVPAAGTALQSVTFTPTNTLTYQTVSVSVNVTVNNATVTLGKLAATYDGTSKAATATTNPTGLTVKLTYNGSATAPKSAGSYAVLATIVDATHTGSASGTLVIYAEPILAWRSNHFSADEIAAGLAADTLDADGDGLSNLAEFTLGTDPRGFSPPPLTVTPTALADHFTLSFLARRAAGVGYESRTRKYTVEATTNLANPTSWQPVTGYSNIVGDDQTVTLTLPATLPNQFYRLNVRLE